MLSVFLFAANALFVNVSAGDPVLEMRKTTISTAAQEVIAQGGTVSCRMSSGGVSRHVCLTGDEWRAVLKDGKEISDSVQDKWIDAGMRLRFQAATSDN